MHDHATEVELIDFLTFEDAVNEPAPAAWVLRPGELSFHLSTLYSPKTSTIYVALNGQYFFKFRDVVTLTHDERVARCIDFLATPKA